MTSNGPERSGARADASQLSAPAFRWSWRFATIAGIGIHIHATFLLLLLFLAFSDLVAGHGVTAMARGTMLILAVFATVVLHELGHALTARRFGVRTRDITLLPIGGVARLERMPEKPGEQLQVALAGPAVNVGIAILLFGLVRLLGVPAGIEGLRQASGPFLTQLMWINVFLAGFNLLPGYPMDGGRVLRALLAMRMAPERATQTAARVGQGVAVIFGLVGLFLSPFLVVIAVFIWLGAQAEHSQSTMKLALAGLSVRDGMITEFDELSSTDSLSRAVNLTLAGFQRDFPVTDGTNLLGILTQGDLLSGLAERGRSSSVREAMQRSFDSLTPADALDGAMTRMHQGRCHALMVIESGRVVGLLTRGNVSAFLALQAAGSHGGTSGRWTAPITLAPRRA